MRLISLLLLLISSVCAAQPEPQIIERDYEGFKLWIDCELRGHVMYSYRLGRDFYDLERINKFTLTSDVPANCQQLSTEPYRLKDVSTFDRGHGVPFNHMEHSVKAAQQTNFMVNVWPQHRDLNRGAMLQTERIADCYRDLGPVTVYGGIIKGATPANSDYFDTHGIHTPAYFWKVLIRKNKAIAWILPNKAGMGKSQLDKYIVSISSLEKIIGFEFPAAEKLKSVKPSRSWIIPQVCGWE